jgi:hypothetical protein
VKLMLTETSSSSLSNMDKVHAKINKVTSFTSFAYLLGACPVAFRKINLLI